MTALFKCFKQQCRRDLILQRRGLKNTLQAMLFFVMIVAFFPLSLPAGSMLNHSMLPGIIWLAALLGMFLSTTQLFQQDYDDGVIEQWISSGKPMVLWVGSKLWVCWLFNVMPLILLTPFLGVLFHLQVSQIMVLALSILLGTPTIILVCGLTAAFSTAANQKGVLMGVILLPLTLPVLIFGSAALHQWGVDTAPLALLLGFSLLSVTLLPFAIASVVKATLV